MPVAPIVFVMAAAGAITMGAVRNQQMQAKKGATTQMRNANAAYEKQKEDARNARNINQASDTNALNNARQQQIMRLQQGFGRDSTFLSNGLGG